MFKGNKGEINVVTIAAIFLIVFSGFATYNWFIKSPTQAAVGEGGTTTPGGVIEVKGGCSISPTLTEGKAEDFYVPATKVTGAYHAVVINGNDLGKFVDGTTRTVSENDKIMIIGAINDSQTNTGYYGKALEFTASCDPAIVASQKGDMRLVKQNVPTFTVLNDDGTVNTNTANQSITAGQVKRVEVRLTGPNNAGFSAGPRNGEIGKLAIACNMNLSNMDEIDMAPVGGSQLARSTYVPPQHSIDSGFTARVWEVNGLTENEDRRYVFILDADDTNAPLNLNCSVYDQDWYQNSVTGTYEYGYANDQNSDIGMTGASWKVNINT